ncbi:hypothetical protein [Paenibacillus sp. SN-8-1]|uniref:hypothetical protein n=1 Tax=Paenibacillus sp. SN-8-1 TaxID=3435409 RepID=UPI003D9A0EC2
MGIIFNKKKKIKCLKKELEFYKPIYELVSHDINWVQLNWRLLRFILIKFEDKNEIEELRIVEKLSQDEDLIDYIRMLIDFFENKISKLHQHFDEHYKTIQPLMKSSPDFFYGYFELILKIVSNIRDEIRNNQISILQLQYLHNYIFFFYSEINEGVNRFKVVSRELENFT